MNLGDLFVSAMNFICQDEENVRDLIPNNQKERIKKNETVPLLVPLIGTDKATNVDQCRTEVGTSTKLRIENENVDEDFLPFAIMTIVSERNPDNDSCESNFNPNLISSPYGDSLIPYVVGDKNHDSNLPGLTSSFVSESQCSSCCSSCSTKNCVNTVMINNNYSGDRSIYESHVLEAAASLLACDISSRRAFCNMEGVLDQSYGPEVEASRLLDVENTTTVRHLDNPNGLRLGLEYSGGRLSFSQTVLQEANYAASKASAFSVMKENQQSSKSRTIGTEPKSTDLTSHSVSTSCMSNGTSKVAVGSMMDTFDSTDGSAIILSDAMSGPFIVPAPTIVQTLLLSMQRPYDSCLASSFWATARRRKSRQELASSASTRVIRTGNSSFQIVVDIQVPSFGITGNIVNDVLDVLANPELLPFWCDSLVSDAPVVVTNSSAVAGALWNRCNVTNVGRIGSFDQNLTSHREYEGEWVEATTLSPILDPTDCRSCVPSVVVGIRRTHQIIATVFGCPSYGRISMFVEKQKRQVSLSFGKLAGGIEVDYKVRVLLLENERMKVQIVNDVSLRREIRNFSSPLVRELVHVVEEFCLPEVEDYIYQTVSSLTRLRFLIENSPILETKKSGRSSR